MYEGYCEEKETDSEAIKKFKKLIKQNNYKTWSDFEWAMAGNINEFKTENDFVECLRDFKKYLNNYLRKEETSFFERYQTKGTLVLALKEEIRKSITYFYQYNVPNITNNIIAQIKTNSIKQYNFIIFNYTNVFNRMISLLDLEFITKKDIHIHGSLKNNDIVLGIDNENQLELKNFKLSDVGKISFIKPIFNGEYDTNRIVDASNAILEGDIICIYGMSLGESDLTWKELIIKWLDSDLSNENKHLFIYDYENYKKNITLKEQQITEERIAKEKFIIQKLKIEESNDKFKKYLNKIHMPFENIFNVNETINKVVSNIEKQDKIVKAKLRNAQILSGGSSNINRF